MVTRRGGRGEAAKNGGGNKTSTETLYGVEVTEDKSEKKTFIYLQWKDERRNEHT